MSWNWRITWSVAMLALFAANHIEHHIRSRRIRREARQANVPVIQIAQTVGGHNTIQIDEQAMERGYLYFNTLESWAYDPDSPTPCPEPVMQADGRKVKLMGFMYPLQEASHLQTFCLLRSTQTCCYGPRPQYNQYVFVEMPEAVKFERLAPVVVEGRFRVDPRPDEGYIYRMEGDSVRPAVSNDEPPNAAEFARQNDLPIFDFAPLESARTAPNRDGGISRLAERLDGQQAVVHGFIVGKTTGPPPGIMIGEHYWDGKAKGTPPNLYNTVLVFPRGPGDVPPLWWQEAVFKGTLRITREPSERPEKGIVALRDAVLAVATASDRGPVVDTGPWLPPGCEILMLAAYAAPLLVRMFSRRGAPTTSPASAGDDK